MTGPERRNDPTHFSPVNGPGHRRRKVINLPTETRFELDPFEVRALEMIGEIDRWMTAEERRVDRARRARDERGGDPGE